MQLDTLAVGQLQANCYLVYDEKSRETLIIDPGDDAEYIQSRLSDLDLIPAALIATHGHFDHIQAVVELQYNFRVPFYLHKDDVKLLAHYRKSTVHFTRVDPGPAPVPDVLLSGMEKLNLANSELEIIPAPGHTPGSIAIYDHKSAVVFVGDTLFADGDVGRTDFSYSDPLALSASIKRILVLPIDTLIFPGHGKSTTVRDERPLHLGMQID